MSVSLWLVFGASSLMDRIFGFVRLIRPINGFMMSLAVLIGAWIASTDNPPSSIIWDLLLGAITAFTLTGASMAINDYCDYEIDKINEPGRPLPSGVVSLRESLILASALTIIGLLASLLINWRTTLLAFISIIVSVSYAFMGKRTGLLGNFMVSFCVAVPFIYGGLIVADGLSLKILFFSLMAFLSNAGREVMKGIVDVEGDRSKGIRTVAVIYGERAAAYTATILILSAVLLSMVPPLTGMVSAWFIPFVTAADIGFIASSVLIIQRPTRENARKIKNLLLAWMMLGMIAFLAGK